MNAKTNLTGRRPKAILCLVVTVFAILLPRIARASFYFDNVLRPFTTDGCSGFPDGIPGGASWLKCCIKHDILYWQGGNAEQKRQADLGLRECVAQTGHPEIADAMYWGVRLGGYGNLPTSWRWGYGWVIPRHYRTLNESEKAQVTLLKKQIPDDLSLLPIASPSAIPERPSITGDYCLDDALDQIEEHVGHRFQVQNVSVSVKSAMQGTLRSLTVSVAGCQQSYHFSFLLLRPKACTTPVTEMLARGRIRLKQVKWPRSCTPRSTSFHLKP